MINVFQPALGERELKAVQAVFESNWVGKGKRSDEFEEAFARHVGVGREHIRGTTCATEGLFQAVNILGLGPGDEVILPSVSFVGAGNAVASSGATPSFCDVDPRTLNPTAETIEAAITPQSRAIMLLHYGGLPCEMADITERAASRSLKLIEDSACSVASRYRGKSCGTFGDIGVWSFDAMKILVTGDGGMLYFADPDLAHQGEESLYLGLVQKSGLSASTASERWWQFDISCFGRRAIMNDLSSAIGLVQLSRLEEFIKRRRSVHEIYDSCLGELEWVRTPPDIPADVESSYYFYWLQLAPRIRDALVVYLRQRDIYATFRYYPLHLVRKYAFSGRLPGAEKAAEETVCIPLHHSLSDTDVTRVVEAIYEFGRTL